MNDLKLFMVLVGCRPIGRNTEQHDVFFGIGNEINDLIPDLLLFWPAANNNIHIDAWRLVTQVDGYQVSIELMNAINSIKQISSTSLFFINLGGYKAGEFEEFHYKMIIAAPDKWLAIKHAKQTAFFKHTGFKGASSHIDDKYGIGVDDLFEVKEILPLNIKNKYQIKLTPHIDNNTDELHLGYMKLNSL